MGHFAQMGYCIPMRRGGEGGGGLPYEKLEDACWKI